METIEKHISFIKDNLTRLNDDDLAYELNLTPKDVKSLIKKHKLCPTKDDVLKRTVLLKNRYSKLPFIKINGCNIENLPMFNEKRLAKRCVEYWTTKYGKYSDDKVLVFKTNTYEHRDMFLVNVNDLSNVLEKRNSIKKVDVKETVPVRIDNSTVKYYPKERCELIDGKWSLKLL